MIVDLCSIFDGLATRNCYVHHAPLIIGISCSPLHGFFLYLGIVCQDLKIKLKKVTKFEFDYLTVQFLNLPPACILHHRCRFEEETVSPLMTCLSKSKQGYI